MDQIFAHVSDLIALSGSTGALLIPAVTAITPGPRAALIAYLRAQFDAQPLFVVTPAEGGDVNIVAHLNLRRRALGFSPIEHPPLPRPAWLLLEAVGQAGPSGMLQAKMGPVVGLQPNMVHHYIGLLAARRLIGRRRTLLQNVQGGSAVSVTNTSVIVLARYAAQMTDPLLSEQAPDSESDIRLKRVLNALRQPPYVKPERDLKSIAIPDSDKPPAMTREAFLRQRHRNFRSLRGKLTRLGLAGVTKRKCVTPTGRVLGAHPCLKLLEQRMEEVGKVVKNERKSTHPLLANGGHQFVAEIDIVEQVYRILVEAGPTGISVPELHEYLDGKSVTSAPSKRIRTIINAISKTHPTVERQYFEGSAMYLRISLHVDGDTGATQRKVGMTSLGKRRQEIVVELLEQRKVMVLETLGREVARVEDGPISRVDSKVMRRLISDLLAQKRVKLITTARPTIKNNPRSQSLVLVALPNVNERGDAVRELVTSVVNRSLYGSQDDARVSPTKKENKSELSTGGKIRNGTEFSGKAARPAGEIQKKGRAAKNNAEAEESEDDDKPIIMYQVADHDKDSEDEEHANEIISEEKDSDVNAQQGFTGTKAENRDNALRPRKRSLDRKVQEGTSTKEELHQISRKRKSSERKDRRSAKRRKNLKSVRDMEEEKNAKTGRLLKGDQKSKKSGEDAILIKTETRNLVGTRILRLRATDYGCLRGKLARVRRFHKNLYEIMKARNVDYDTPTPAVERMTIEAARETRALGRFSFISVLQEMTVGEYAATVGIYLDHGDAIKTIEKEKIIHVLDDMKSEITSNVASRQVQQFVQTMTKLELIQSDADSKWLLAGAGIIRDFGRGLPSDVVPHGIVFSSVKAVEEYWLELEQFSRCRLAKKPLSIDLRNEENVKQIESHPIGDLYFPKRWTTGVHRLRKQEQLTYETILQRLSGVQMVLSDTARLRTDNFITGKLRRFEVEEIDKEMERVLADTRKAEGKPPNTKRGLSSEQLLLYSRFRNANPIPNWCFKNMEAIEKREEDPSSEKKENHAESSSLLQLTRTPSSIKGQKVRAATPSVFDGSHSRYFKARAKRKPKKEPLAEGRAELKHLTPLIKAILRGRAVAYHKNDAQGLDWKVVPSLARYELRKSAADLPEAVDRESLRRAVVGLCEVSTVRGALDILSLQLVLRLQRFSTLRTSDKSESASATEIPETALSLVNEWQCLDEVCSAIIMEVHDDIRHHARVLIQVPGSEKLHDIKSRRRVLSKEFCLNKFMHSRPRSFAHAIEMMASRFRRVADIRLFRKSHHAILLSEPYGETGGGDGILKDNEGQPSQQVDGPNAEGHQDEATTEGDSKGIEATNDSQCSPIKRHTFSEQCDNGIPQYAPQLAELVVCAAVRQPSHAQWKTECVKLLSQVREEDLADARDRLLLRGSVALHVERGKTYCSLRPARASQPYKTMAAFRGEMRHRGKWEREVQRTGEGSLETTSLWHDVCSLEGNSSIAAAYSTFSTFYDRLGLSLVPEFEEDDEAAPAGPPAHDDDEDDEANPAAHDDDDDNEEGVVTRIKLYFHSGADGELNDGSRPTSDSRRKTETVRRSQSGDTISQESAKSWAAMRQTVGHEIAERGRSGVSLETLLLQLNPQRDDEKMAIAKALHMLLREGGIRRFAVETDDEELNMTTGVFYICSIHSLPITAWRHVNGDIDEQLVERIRDEVLECILQRPGVKVEDVIKTVCKRHTSMPRRAVVDILFALEGELIVNNVTIWRDGWQLVKQDASFVDEMAIMTWGQRTIQSYRGIAARIYDEKYSISKGRLSQIL